MGVTQFAVPTNDGGGKGNNGDGKGSASRVGDIFQTEIDAVNKLNEALKGVEALNAVVGLMEATAEQIGAAKAEAVTAIQTQRDIAIGAIRLEKAGLLEQVQKLLDPFLNLFRKGD